MNDIVKEFVNNVVPVVITAGITVAVAVIKSVGAAAVSYIQARKDAAITKMGVEQYNHELSIAKNVYGIVDEFFRTNPSIEKNIEAAQAKFEEEILKRIPYLTSENIDHLRQTVAGEVNKGREVIKTPAAEEKKDVATTSVQ